MKIQVISDAADDENSIINHSEIGKRLQSAALNILEDFLTRYDFGFQDGGCYIFALGLQKWSQNNLTLRAVRSTEYPQRIQHVVACYNDLFYLDSDGLASDSDMVSKMDVFSSLKDHYITEMETLDPEIPTSEVESSKIARQLEAILGPYRSDFFEHIYLVDEVDNSRKY